MMKRRAFFLVCILGLLCAGTYAQQISTAAQDNETPALWLLELTGPPTADGGSLASIRAEKNSFRAEAQRAGIAFRERFAFDNLFNGLSIEINTQDLPRLIRVGGVKNLYPVIPMALPEPKAENDLDLLTALSMTGADIAQSQLGLSGSGVRVGIIDTGIDYHHPDLGGCFGSGCRVAVGYDFVGDAYNGSNAPAPDSDPMDCYGHGTHVSGIVGANGLVKGVAPEVTFGAYRVFGCSGYTTADIMIAAMERALADNMQVINMSIGAGFQWPEYPTAAASTRLVNKGVVVVSSAGNDGASGLYAISAPSVGDKVISVASFDNTRVNLTAFSITPDGKLVSYIPASAAPPAPLSGTFQLASTNAVRASNIACSPLSAGSLNGKVALILRGTCSFYWKAHYAQEAGAAAVVIYNNTSGFLNISVDPTATGLTPPCTPSTCPPITIPVVSILQADGDLIFNRLASGSVSMTWTNQVVSLPNATADQISSFSSFGLSPDLSLKPDIGAPGGYIRSTFPLALGSYANLSGTSMSSPHVAGAVALYLEAHPKTPAQSMQTILQNSAVPHDFPGYPFLDNAHRQGAGMLRIDDAVLATTKIEPGKLSLGASQTGPIARTLSLKNESYRSVIYDLSYENALSTGGVITPSFYLSDASVRFNSPSVTVPARGTASVDVSVTAPSGPDKGQYGGYIIFAPRDGGPTYRVPFAGFIGNYQSIQVLTPTGNGFPWLAKLLGGYFLNRPSGATFTLQAGDIPYILVHLDHQARYFRMEVYDAVTGKAWHRASQYNYIARNSTPTGFFYFTWDGTTVNGKQIYAVPNGSYVIKLSILKALGEDTNPADIESWTSPVITINRP